MAHTRPIREDEEPPRCHATSDLRADKYFPPRKSPYKHRTIISLTSLADYSDEEREWLVAVDNFKRRWHLTDLSPIQILELAKSLGYRKEAVS